MTDLMFAQSVTRKYVIGGGKSCSAPQSSASSSQSTSGSSSPTSSLSSSPPPPQQPQPQQNHRSSKKHPAFPLHQLVRSSSAIVESGLSVVDHGGFARNMQQQQQSTQQSSQANVGSSSGATSSSGPSSSSSSSSRQLLPRRTEFDNKDRRRLNIVAATASAASSSATSSAPQPPLSSTCVLNQAVLDLKIEANRRLTFEEWPVAFISADELARHGFFYFKHRDYARCVFCGVQINEWIEGDVVADEHYRWSPKCPFVRGCDVGNVPLHAQPRASAGPVATGATANTAIGTARHPLPLMPGPIQQTITTTTAAATVAASSAPIGYDTCGLYGIEIRPNSVPERLWPQSSSSSSTTTTSTSSSATAATAATTASSNSSSSAIQFNLRNTAVSCGPQYPSMNSYESRLQSFNEWPRGLPRRPKELAEAGFFYTGNSDKVICFHCGGGLKNWGPNDNAWHNHAKWFSRCAFVLLQRGQDYVAEVSRIDRPLMSMSDASELFRNQPPLSQQLARQQTHQINHTAPAAPNNRTSASATNTRPQSSSSTTTTNSPSIEATYPSQASGRGVSSPSATTTTTASTAASASAISLAAAETSAATDPSTASPSSSSSTTHNQSDPDEDNDFEIIEMSAAASAATATATTASSTSSHQPQADPASSVQVSTADVQNPAAVSSVSVTPPPPTTPEATSANNQNKRAAETVTSSSSSSSSSSPPPATVSDDRLCKICYNHELETALIPCHHVVACVNCAPSLSSCPVCKQPLQAIVRLFLC